jgi:hypothetical protein
MLAHVEDKMLSTPSNARTLKRHLGILQSLTQANSLPSLPSLLLHTHPGNPLTTPSNATNATAFAGNALKKHGKNPLQYPLHPFSLYTALAASRHLAYFLPEPRSSVIIRCLTTSDGYDVSQKI